MKLHHIAITVSDIKKSTEFYTSIFGFKIIKQFKKEEIDASIIFLKSDNIYLELWQFRQTRRNKLPLEDLNIIGIRHIAFEVKNLEETVSYLKRKGLHVSEIKLGASKHNYAFTKDPDGIPIELYER